jgi:hypothetical protein
LPPTSFHQAAQSALAFFRASGGIVRRRRGLVAGELAQKVVHLPGLFAGQVLAHELDQDRHGLDIARRQRHSDAQAHSQIGIVEQFPGSGLAFRSSRHGQGLAGNSTDDRRWIGQRRQQRRIGFAVFQRKGSNGRLGVAKGFLLGEGQVGQHGFHGFFGLAQAKQAEGRAGKPIRRLFFNSQDAALGPAGYFQIAVPERFLQERQDRPASRYQLHYRLFPHRISLVTQPANRILNLGQIIGTERAFLDHGQERGAIGIGPPGCPGIAVNFAGDLILNARTAGGRPVSRQIAQGLHHLASFADRQDCKKIDEDRHSGGIVRLDGCQRRLHADIGIGVLKELVIRDGRFLCAQEEGDQCQQQRECFFHNHNLTPRPLRCNKIHA